MTNNDKIQNHSAEAKNALHRLTYSEDMRMPRMLEDIYDLLDAVIEANKLVDVAKPDKVIEELTQRKADRAICKEALNA